MMETDIQLIIDELRNDIEKTMQEVGINGLAISLFDKENTLWMKGFGHTDDSNNREIDSDTIFSIQSIGKVFTSIAFQRAIQLGLISLDDKLIDYYPEFTVNSRYGDPEVEKITFRHLLSHFAGFTHNAPIGGEWDRGKPTFDEYIKSFSETWLRYPVEERYQYSNLGMSLVAYCLQKVSKMSFPDFVTKEVCEPLGIVSLAYGKDASLKNPNRAIGYYKGYEAEFSNIIFYGAGGQYISINDMTKFIQFLLNDGKVNGQQLIAKDLLEEMAVKQFTTEDDEIFYGLGLEINKEALGGIEIRNHTGGGFGYNAIIAWIMEHDIGIVIFTNYYAHQNAQRIAFKALRRVLEVKGVAIKTPEKYTPETYITKPKKTVDIELLRKLEGIYTISGGMFEFIILEDKPFVIYNNQKFELFSHSPTEFTSTIPIGIKIKTNEKGQPISAKVLMVHGVVLKFEYIGKKKEDLPGPDEESWKKYFGIYTSNYLGDDIYVGVGTDNGHLTVNFGGKKRLEKFQENLFFTDDGRAVKFSDNELNYDNISLLKINSPTKKIKEILARNPKDRNLEKRNFVEIQKTLEFLGNEEELITLKKIYEELYGAEN